MDDPGSAWSLKPAGHQRYKTKTDLETQHQDARAGGSIPGLGSFNTLTLAPNNGNAVGSAYRPDRALGTGLR